MIDNLNLVSTIYILYFGLLGVTIIAIALILALATIMCMSK